MCVKNKLVISVAHIQIPESALLNSARKINESWPTLKASAKVPWVSSCPVECVTEDCVVPAKSQKFVMWTRVKVEMSRKVSRVFDIHQHKAKQWPGNVNMGTLWSLRSELLNVEGSGHFQQFLWQLESLELHRVASGLVLRLIFLLKGSWFSCYYWAFKKSLSRNILPERVEYLYHSTF